MLEEDFINYKVPCMTVMFPYCTFKCNKECGKDICQNTPLKDSEIIEINADEIVERYISNPISEAIVMQGLEPFDSFEDLCALVCRFSKKSNDDVVIFTGYEEDEITDKVADLKSLTTSNTLIIKFGRFLPNQTPHLDSVLGVKLASDNQYGKVV